MNRICLIAIFLLRLPIIIAQTSAPSTTEPTPDPSPAPSIIPSISLTPSQSLAPSNEIPIIDPPDTPDIVIPTSASPSGGTRGPFPDTSTSTAEPTVGRVTLNPVPLTPIIAPPISAPTDPTAGLLDGIINTVLCQTSANRIGSVGIEHNSALDSTSYTIDETSPVDVASYIALIKDQAKTICDGEEACIASVDDFTQQAIDYVALEGQIVEENERTRGRRRLKEILPKGHGLSEDGVEVIERILLHVSQNSEEEVISLLEGLEEELLAENSSFDLASIEKEVIDAAISVGKASTSYWHKVLREEHGHSFRRLQGNIVDCALTGNSHYYKDTSDTDFSKDNPFQDQDRRNMRNDSKHEIKPTNKRPRKLRRRNGIGSRKLKSSKKSHKQYDKKDDDYWDPCMRCSSWQECDRCYNSQYNTHQGNYNPYNYQGSYGNSNLNYGQNSGYNSGMQYGSGGYNSGMQYGYNNGYNNHGPNHGYDNGRYNNNNYGYNNGMNMGYNNGNNQHNGGYGGGYQDDFFWYPKMSESESEEEDDVPLGIDDVVEVVSSSGDSNPGFFDYVFNFLYNVAYVVRADVVGVVVGVVVGRGCILPAAASSFLFSALYFVCYRRPGRP